MNFRINLIRLRKAKKLSQTDLAKLVGVRPQSVQQWEVEGGTAPSRRNQEKVANALGISPAELMYGQNELNDQNNKLIEAKSMLAELTDENLEMIHSALKGILSTNKREK